MNKEFKEFKEAYDMMERKVIDALKRAVINSRHTIKDYDGNVIPVNVYNYVALGIIDNKLTFFDNNGDHYNLYAECSLEDLIDILTKLPEKKDITLKVETKTTNIIDVHDFNNFVEAAYGGWFEFEAIHEAGDSLYEFEVPSVVTFFGDDKEKIRSGNYQTCSTHKVFQLLYLDGYLNEGNYTIDNR